MSNNLESLLEEVNGMTANALARDAECYSPDGPGSPGAAFLARVRDDMVEQIESADDGSGYLRNMNDAMSEVADSAVPTYTSDLWETFADLGAWTEDPSELGADCSDMGQAARTCLFLIAERLAGAIVIDVESDLVED